VTLSRCGYNNLSLPVVEVVGYSITLTTIFASRKHAKYNWKDTIVNSENKDINYMYTSNTKQSVIRVPEE